MGEIASGFDYGMNSAAKSYDGKNKYIRITDIDASSASYSNNYIVSPDGKLQNNYLVNKNDILLARTGASTGKSYLYESNDGRLYFAGFLIRINIPKENPYFIFTQFHTSNYKKWVSIMSARSGQPGINSQEYSSYLIYVTGKQEQDKISSLLSLLDERIAAQNKIIEDLKKLKSAIYQFVFDNEIGPFLPLESIANIVKGQQVNGECLSESGDYYVMNGGIEPSGYYSYCNTEANTISISEGGNSCGYVQYNDVLFWSGGHCYTLQNLSTQIEEKYLFHYLKHKESTIMKLRIGTGLPNIQKKDLAKFNVLIPSTERQIALYKVFNSVDAKLSIENKLQKSFESQKSYLLQQMFI